VPRFSELSAVQLVQVCAGSKDAGAWEEFIRRFQPVIARAVLRTARLFPQQAATPQLIDDLIQDTYLKLCQDDSRLLRSFQPRGDNSIYGFLKVVATSIVHDYYKSALAEKRGAGQTDAIDEQIDPRTQGTNGVDIIHRNLQLEQIDKILLQVTAGKDQQRKCTIFWLRHRQGLTASEIAALPTIGLSTEGVESVLLRLTTMIRGHIDEGKTRRANL
jgi:RNA polymerase sigma-70 factor, ECF subfamily